MRHKLVAIAAAFIGLAGTSNAATINFDFGMSGLSINQTGVQSSINSSGNSGVSASAQGQRTLILPVFNTALGTLTKIELGYDVFGVQFTAQVGRPGCTSDCGSLSGGTTFTAIASSTAGQFLSKSLSAGDHSNGLSSGANLGSSESGIAGFQQVPLTTSELLLSLSAVFSIRQGGFPPTPFNATFAMQGSVFVQGRYTYEPGPSPVPLPGAVWLLAAALGALGVVWRRRSRRVQHR